MLCPKCGFAAYPNDTFCRNCGSTLPAGPAPRPAGGSNTPNYVNVPRQNKPPIAAAVFSAPGSAPSAAAAAGSVSPAGVRALRILAFVLDGLLCVILPLFAAVALNLIFPHITDFLAAAMLIVMTGCFWLRDLVGGGISFGKRILGLRIYDKAGKKPASLLQCFLRSLFLLIMNIDGIIMLATGATLGDRVAGTVVLRRADTETPSDGGKK